MNLKNRIAALLISSTLTARAQPMITLSRDQLHDKIMGGWAGQTIGVTYGAPVEFRYNGTMVNAYHKLNWYDGLLKKTMVESPGVYDDLYMDLTFVEVFEHEGLDAPAASHAKAFANAGYMLWHANQAARYNLLNGIAPPASGYWLNNPHADCIDYQIESDFAGLMSPGMPNTASEISDKIGHIMNYGDGWYGGVFTGAMYSLTFISDDIDFIVNEALKTIPENTDYHQCISDVISWHKAFPDDWRETWFRIQKKWTDEKGCPEGVFSPFDIDAKVNSAYVVLGLLYGQKDFGKTLEITTRCGQDADCNPSSAGGILGTMLGYRGIPDYWKMGLKDIEDMDFKYTTTSLNEAYDMGTKQALLNIKRNGGRMSGDTVYIKRQTPTAVRREISFKGLNPVEKRWIGKNLNDTLAFHFTGNGFVVGGECRMTNGPGHETSNDKYATVEVFIDGKLSETVKLPVNPITRRHEICWNYQLPEKKHEVELRLIHPDPEIECFLSEFMYYSHMAAK